MRTNRMLDSTLPTVVHRRRARVQLDLSQSRAITSLGKLLTTTPKTTP